MGKKNIILTFLCLGLSFIVMPSAGAFELISIQQQGSSVEVLRIQNRLIDLDYFFFKTTGTFGSMTRESIIRFQEVNEVMADGVVGEETYALLFSNDAKRNSIPAAVHIPFGPTSSEAKAEYGQLADWDEVVDQSLRAGDSVTITDLNTGQTLKMTRTGGTHHAKMETSSSADTETFLTIFGDEFNWSKRPVTVEIGGILYAASLQGMPYGQDIQSGNNMEGSCALFFQNSRSDSTNLIDEEHRRTVLRASGQDW